MADDQELKLDFSEFHPLDHWPGDSYCRSLPGGIRRHLHDAWTYRQYPELRAATLCRLGRHNSVPGFMHVKGFCKMCRFCWKYLGVLPPDDVPPEMLAFHNRVRKTRKENE